MAKPEVKINREGMVVEVQNGSVTGPYSPYTWEEGKQITREPLLSNNNLLVGIEVKK